MKKLMRNDPCWCGSKKPYCECHMDFDKKIEMYRKKFHKVPPRSIIKNEEQLQGMRESSKINIAVLDCLQKKKDVYELGYLSLDDNIIY